jgi:hypothetical protein
MGATVTVGCKLPHGLIAEVGDKSFTFNGANDSDLIGGHGITYDVPKDFWDAWVAQVSAWFVPFKNKLVFAHESEKSVTSQAKEMAKEITGFEGLKPNDPKNGVKTAEV